MNPTDAEIRELIEAEAKATPGPWCDPRDGRVISDEGDVIVHQDSTLADEVECALIVCARNLARPLAMEVLRLRAANKKLRELVEAIDYFGVHHAVLCNVTPQTSCTCGCDELQERINEVLA